MEHISNVSEVVTASLFSFRNVANPFRTDTNVIPKNTDVRLFGNRVLRKVVGRKRENIAQTGFWIKLHNEELHNVSHILLG
jgi:hypothetical protein